MGSTVANLLSLLDNFLITGLGGMAGTFIPLGYKFLGLALTITLLNAVYQFWVKGGTTEMIASLVRLGIITVIPLTMLANWTDMTGVLSNFFQKGLPTMMGYGTGSPSSVVGNAVSNLLSAVDLKPPEGESAGFWSLSTDTITTWFISQILWLLVSVLSLLLTAAMVFSLYMPLAGMGLGIIFGPLMIGWMPFDKMANLSEKWFGFMIGNGMSFAVAIAIMKAMEGTIISMASDLSKVIQEGGPIVGSLVTILGILAIFLFATNLVLKANEIASGMTGGATVGEGLFGNLAAAGAAKMGGAMAKTAGGVGLAGAGALSKASGLSGAASKAAGAVKSTGAALSQKGGAVGAVARATASTVGRAMEGGKAGMNIAKYSSGATKLGKIMKGGDDK